MSKVVAENLETIDGLKTIPISALVDSRSNVYSLFKGVYYPKYSVSDHGDSTIEGSIAYIVSQIGSDVGHIILPPGEYTLGSSLTIPSNVTLQPMRGAFITLGAYNLVIGNLLPIGVYQWINATGVGSVSFGESIYIAYPEWWGIDGIADEVQINQAMQSLTHGFVICTASTYTTATSIVGADDVFLKGSSQGGTVITSSDATAGIFLENVQGSGVTDLHLNTLIPAATGIKMGDNCEQVTLERLLINYSGVPATALGVGILFADAGNVSLHNSVRDVKVNTFKFGAQITNSSVTSISFHNCLLLGNTASILPGSIGLYCDGDAGGGGSTFIGGSIEGYAEGYTVEDGSSGFMDVICHFEHNTLNVSPTTLGNRFSGEVRDNSDDRISKASDGTGANQFLVHDNNGYHTHETYYDQRHVITGAGVRYWGAFSGGLNKSYIAGDIVYPQGGFQLEVTSQNTPTTEPEKCRMFIRDKFISFATAVPTAGTWGQSSFIFNVNSGEGQPLGWSCVTSGTFSDVATTGGITDGTPDLVVADATGLFVGAYIDIVGVIGIKKIVAISGFAVTLDSNADATVVGAAVTTPDPTFETVGQVGNRSGAGDPTGAITPLSIGEEYLNTTGNHWYKSHGLTNADWTALN